MGGRQNTAGGKVGLSKLVTNVRPDQRMLVPNPLSEAVREGAKPETFAKAVSAVSGVEGSPAWVAAAVALRAGCPAVKNACRQKACTAAPGCGVCRRLGRVGMTVGSGTVPPGCGVCRRPGRLVRRR